MWQFKKEKVGAGGLSYLYAKAKTVQHINKVQRTRDGKPAWKSVFLPIQCIM